MSKLQTFILSLLNSLFPPKKTYPTIDSYGQTTCGIPIEQIQFLMEWLFESLFAAGYIGNAHLIWYDDAHPNPDLEQAVSDGIRQEEPTFLYRCGSRTLPLPTGYYWRMITEHPSTRIYQLEISSDD